MRNSFTVWSAALEQDTEPGAAPDGQSSTVHDSHRCHLCVNVSVNKRQFWKVLRVQLRQAGKALYKCSLLTLDDWCADSYDASSPAACLTHTHTHF